MRSAPLYVFVALGFAVVGCSKEPKESKAWTCQSLGVPGGETLQCTTAALTSDGPALIGGDGTVTYTDEEGCEGSTDNPELCPPDATSGGAGGSESTEGTSGGGSLGGSYLCTAGTTDCPPIAAIPGINDGTSSSGSGTGGAGSGEEGSGAGGGSGGKSGGDGTSDGTSATGDGSGTGGGGGGGDKKGDGDKTEGSGDDGAGGGGTGSGGTSDGTGDSTSSTGSGAGKGGGAGSGPEQYRCEKKKGGRIDCTRTTPECSEGLTPSGAICSSGSGGTTDGSSSTGSGTDSGSGSGGDSGSGTTVTDNSPPTSTDNGKTVDLKTVTTHPDGSKTWTYEVCEVSGHDLSNWVLGIGNCPVVGASPNQGFEKVSSDPNSGLSGVKWNTGSINGCVTYTVTTQGGTTGLVKFSAKASTGVSYGMVQGPVCQ